MRIMILLVFFSIGYNNCFNIIPERTQVWYYNKKYIGYINTSVRRYVRRGHYYFNLELETLASIDDNVTVFFTYLEYLHNEYRPSFVELRLKYCSVFNNPYVGPTFRLSNLTGCPLLPAEYHFMNISADTSYTNSFKFPFEKGRIDLELRHTDTDEGIFKFSTYALFKDVRKESKKKGGRPPTTA